MGYVIESYDLVYRTPDGTLTSILFESFRTGNDLTTEARAWIRETFPGSQFIDLRPTAGTA
jgi:hypothetical protein